MEKILYRELSYKIIGRCLDVHNNLGCGFSEIVYKDALSYEFKMSNISFEREKQYQVHYKNILLPHKFYADFVVEQKIILEVKAIAEISDLNISQAINYLRVSKNRLAIIVNFGDIELEYKRIIN